MPPWDEPSGRPGASAEEASAKDPLRLLFEVAPDATLVLTANGENDRILEANRAACQLTGYSREELLRLSPDGLLAPEARPWTARVQSALGSGRSATAELALLRHDGRRIAAEMLLIQHESQGQVTILAIAGDTANVAQARRAIRQRERQLEALVRSLDDLVFEMDDQLRFLAVWAREERTLFLPREQLLGRTVHEALGDELGSFFAAPIREAMNGGRPVAVEYPAPWPGSPIWFSARIAPVDEGHLPAQRAVVTIHDITARRQAEEQLRRSEEEFRGIWEHSPIALELYDADGRVVRANQAALDMFGVASFADVEGFNLFADPNLPEEYKQAIRRGETVRGQFSYSLDSVRSGGLYRTSRPGVFDLDALTTPLRDAQGNVSGYLVHIQDITERVRAQEALEESERRYRLLFHNSMTAFSLQEVVVDEAGKPCDYVFLDVNPAFERAFGTSRERVVGKRALEVLPDLDPALIERYGRVALTGEPDEFVAYSGHHGRYYEVRAYMVQPGQLAVLSLDVTESKLAEQALRESERRYRLLAENMQEALFSYDADGHLRYANPAVETLTGYPVADFLSGRLMARSTVHPEDRVRGLRHWSDAVDRAITSTTEYRIITKAGELKWVSATFTPVFDEAHRQVGAQLLVSDITERRKLQEQLLQAHKMESVGRLAGGVAHDFNNILTAISGYAEFILERLEEDSEVRADVLEVIRNTERASNLTRQLLAFSRKQTMEMRPTDLNALVADLARLFRRLIGEHIELVVLPGADLATVLADPAQIEQVLANLAVNARDAMPNGGTLTIATRNVQLSTGSEVADAVLAKGDYVCLDVSDTGHGMSPEVLEHLFEPFFTTKEVGKGTGLGLATIYGIVKQHGGDIAVRSEVGRGSVFSVYLPAAARVETQAQAAPSAIAARGSERVLLVEDDPAVRSTVRRALQRLGYSVIEASNGAEAIERLAQTDEQPALVITDLVMPQMGGLELVRVLRASHPDLRVLFTSGYTEDAAALATAVDAGNFYLQKPFNVAELSAKVHEALTSE